MCRINRHSVLTIDDFTIAPGEHWCVFGPNGAGKSIFSMLLSGKRRESASYVSFAPGFDPAVDCLFVSFEEQQRLWQQDNRLDMSEYSENAEDKGTVVRSLILAGRDSANHDDALFALLVEQLDLGALLDKGIRFLSSGQVRKALIARALYAAKGSQAKLLVLDDPLESIDKDSRQRISACIEAQLQGNFASILLCRRQQDILPGMTHLALMQNFKILARGQIAEVLESEAFSTLTSTKPAGVSELPKVDVAASADSDAESGPYIELKSVNASYGDLNVLNNINWTMESSDHVLIEGPNGCGKSTLLSLIDGENHKGYGQDVYLFGKRKGGGETIWDIKAQFGIVSNELHNKYVKGWKVLDVVVSGFYDSVGLYDDSGAAEWEAANQWLATLGIAALQSHYYHELSFGQQRLVLLARAMVKQPKILILDEPCVGLDDYHRQLILSTLAQIAEQTSTRIIYVSHVSDEEPAFITQRLSFVPAASGGYTLQHSQA